MRRRALSVTVMALILACAWAATARAVSDKAFTTLSQVERVRIDEPSTTVRLPLPNSGLPFERLKTALAEPASWNPTELVLEDIRFDAPPGVLFDVFLSAPGRDLDRQYVGTLTFSDTESSRRAFEVTLKLKKLRNERSELPGLQLVFEASLGTEDPTLTFADAQKRFNREAGLRVGSIRLRIPDEP